MVTLKGGTLTDKFKLAKAAGFGAIEVNCPGIDVADVKKAVSDSGLPVDGSVGATHWQVRHTHEDAAVRAKALENLKRSLIETEAVGGKTCLLVVGHGNDGSEVDVWQRSVDNISLALPLAGKLGVSIVVAMTMPGTISKPLTNLLNISTISIHLSLDCNSTSEIIGNTAVWAIGFDS